ncbi:hypothetical protein CHELA40_11958 [Chelatococcus asaccharovorans]|nr:hypothetical protein CHELA40_11958 [Chelatococcus asaccharovorans]
MSAPELWGNAVSVSHALLEEFHKFAVARIFSFLTLFCETKEPPGTKTCGQLVIHTIPLVFAKRLNARRA